MKNVSADFQNLKQEHIILQQKYNTDIAKLGRETSLQRLRIKKLVEQNLKLKEELAEQNKDSVVQVGDGIQQISIGGESHGIHLARGAEGVQGGGAAFIITRKKLN